MRILYLSYWPATDPLSASIIYPRLKFLASLKEVESIYFISIERGEEFSPIELEGVIHLPFNSIKSSFLLITKLRDFIGLIKLFVTTIKKNRVEFAICNSTLAGSIGYIASFFYAFKLIVECFEPHADYMRESGVWHSWGIRYNLLKFLEWRQRRTAFKLLTVSSNYSNYLHQSGVENEKIVMVPNGIDLNAFAFNPHVRDQIRLQLQIPKDDLVGIYVGKFGGIYYHKEAFDLFMQAFNFFGSKFNLIILTTHPIAEIVNEFRIRGVDVKRVKVFFSANSKVPEFLSCADFAFATIKPAPIRKYCCPIKVGEYWANGLPVILEPEIGDDSDIVLKEGGGTILDMENSTKAFQNIQEMIETSRSVLATKIFHIASRHRDFALVEEAYVGIFTRV